MLFSAQGSSVYTLNDWDFEFFFKLCMFGVPAQSTILNFLFPPCDDDDDDDDADDGNDVDDSDDHQSDIP